ncbi:serine hydrolase [soil metagenome]
MTLGLGPVQVSDSELAGTIPDQPEVSARAWAIADGKTGELLWGHDEDVPAKAASTTKMMTAWLVLKLIEEDESVLDEVVTFSKLADDTSGSTADIREGESISVRECLYGLLLPSGNDAGNALAEHFNNRFAPPQDATIREGLETRARFIAEMNREAKRLGMDRTTYRSTFGDGGTSRDRTTTPRDLLTLAHNVMQNLRFREYVGTRRYATQVEKPDGTPHDVEWVNTNQLLGREGYNGIKTGTTSQAGACLVSSGRRGEDHLLVVVLGSASTPARYSDSKALFDWAWSRRAQPSGSP